MDNHYDFTGAGELDHDNRDYKNYKICCNSETPTEIYRGAMQAHCQSVDKPQRCTYICIQRPELIECLHWIQIDMFKPILNESPTYWRLVVPGSDATQVDELVLTLQGVIASKDLPPVLKK